MGNLILTWAVNHQGYLYGLASGYALAHIPEAVGFLFHLAMKVPFIRSAIVKNPAKAKEAISAIEKELEKDIDQEAADSQQPH